MAKKRTQSRDNQGSFVTVEKNTGETVMFGEPLLTFQEVADMFSVTKSQVQNWKDTGRIKFVRTPSGRAKIPKCVAEAFLTLYECEQKFVHKKK